MADADLAFLPALEQAKLIQSKELSPVELVDHYLERADRLNPQINGYLTIAHDHARAAARIAEEQVQAGGDLPPFLGVPVSIKDLTDTAGIRTTKGTAAYRDRIPDTDARIVADLKRAGFVVIGKSNTPEFGIGSTDPIAYGPARNPWNPDLTTRGSSGGAAAVLAAGLCAISEATDGGGSIRLPAATCGTVGLKPSRGRVSSAPAAQHLNTQAGPISRTVADAAAFLDCIAGYATGDGFWAPPPPRPFVDEARMEPGRLRVACVLEGPGADVHPEYRDAVLATAKLLDELGHEVLEDRVPWPDNELLGRFIWAFSGTLIAIEDDLPPLDTLDPTIVSLMDAARQIPLKAYLQTERDMGVAARAVVGFFDTYDVALMPTVIAPPRPVSELRDEQGRPRGDSGVGPFCFFWNVTGQPAITLPLYEDTNGLPIGIQLVGRPADEATLLRLSAQLEAALPWSGRRPAVS